MKGSERALQREVAVLAFRQAEAAGDVEETGRALARAGSIVRGNFSLRQVLMHPRIAAERKLELLRSLVPFRGTAESVVRAALERRLAALLPGIAGSYATVAAARSATATVRVETASPLARADAVRIQEAIARSLGRPVVLKVVTRRDLIGGIRVVAGEMVIDGTVKGAFDRLERELATEDSRRG